MRYSGALLAGLLLIAGVSYAGQRGDSNMAGCGPGQMVVQSPTNGPQFWASSTNQTFYMQAFGITFGTSGCSAEGAWAKRRQERQRFVASNFRNLSQDLARGDGEYALSLATMMGCRAEAVPAFLSVTKGSYSKLFPEGGTTPVKMLNTLESEVTSNEALSSVCTL